MRHQREEARRGRDQARRAREETRRAARATAEAEARAAAEAQAAARARAAAEAQVAAQAQAAAKARAAAAAAEVIPVLRQLGFRAGEARCAAALCAPMSDAPLEHRVRVALSYFAKPAHAGRASGHRDAALTSATRGRLRPRGGGGILDAHVLRAP
jgi:hypothetical protein